MHYRYFQAVASCAAAIAFATTTLTTPVNAAEWTSFKVGTLSSYSIGYASLPDGRFVLGTNGGVQVQKTFGAATLTPVANTDNVTFDPSFVAVRNATSGLIGAGGFADKSGLFGFDPSTPATAISSTPLATVQNYGAVYWKHPTSGREGWLIGGLNGSTYAGFFGPSKKHIVMFVSADGAYTGAITGDLCTYSSGIAVDAAGNLFASLYEIAGSPDEADAEKVMKFTAAQVDAAVAAVIAGAATPVARADATLVFQFDSASSIAVDSLGRLWASGYKVDYLQAFDPVANLSRIFIPDHPALKHAMATPFYQVQTFAHAGINYVGFLGNDSADNFGSDVVYGYKKESELLMRSVTFDVASQTVGEGAGTVSVRINISPTPAARVSVPLTYSGTAVRNKNYTAAASSVIFNSGDTFHTIDIKVIDDAVDQAVNNILIVRLGVPSPVAQAGLASAAASSFALTITDNDVKPAIAAVQNFVPATIGSNYTYQVVLTNGTATPKFTASGLPPGMTINRDTGVISGRPTVPGEYDQVWITATSSAGTSVTAGYVITVADFSAAAHGGFVGYVDRDLAATNGLGARIDVSVTKTATFTGKVTLGTTAYAFSGLLDTSGANPAGSATFKRGSTTYSVAFIIDTTTGALSGSLGSAGIHGWHAQTASILTGPHNFFAATPGGPAAGDPHGTTYGSINVLATGVASTSIHAADGSVFASSAPIGPSGEVLVYQTAYSVPGSLLGNLTIAGDTTQTVGGTLTWFRPTAAGGWGTSISLTAKGGKYHPVSGAGIVMDLAAATGNNATLAFQDGGVTATSASFHLAAPALATLASPSKLTITNSTGAFSGLFKFGTGATSILVSFQGLIVPDITTADAFDGTGEGYFLTPGTGSVVTRSGMVSLSAAP